MKIKKLIAIVLCFVMCALVSPMVHAAITPQVTLTNEAAFPGEEVNVNVLITNNPGIMSMAFSLKYDTDAFEFITCEKGFVSTPTYKNHEDKGYVAFSISETSNKINSGVIISATFKIKRSAKPNTYSITLASANPTKNGNDLSNCFANAMEEKIVPVVKNGSIRVKGECDVSGHKFGEWNITTPATCNTTGIRQRVCTVCNVSEEQTLPFEHNYENDWTVDKAATPEEDGIMSRHCTICGVTTDELTFTYKEVTGEGDDNTSSENTSSDVTSSTDNVSSDNTTSGGVSSVTSDSVSSDVSSNENTSSDNTTSENTSSSSNSTSSNNTSSEPKPNQKPVINNVPGEKVPQTEAEKLENYDVVIPPVVEDVEENETPENTSSSSTTSSPEQQNVSTQTGATTEDDQAFLSTTSGIIVLILCAILSVGVLAVAVLLILKNRKEN